MKYWLVLTCRTPRRVSYLSKNGVALSKEQCPSTPKEIEEMKASSLYFSMWKLNVCHVMYEA